MNIIERREAIHPSSIPVVTRSASDSPIISGHAAVFYDGTPATEFTMWDDSGGIGIERIMPTAFDAALSRPDDVRGLFNHDANYVLGRTSAGSLRLSKDGTGLHYAITPPSTSVVRDVLELLRHGEVSGSSFAFTIDRESWSEEKRGRRNVAVREIQAVHLFDVSPVTYPAYPATDAGIGRAASGAGADYVVRCRRDHALMAERARRARQILAGLRWGD